MPFFAISLRSDGALVKRSELGALFACCRAVVVALILVVLIVAPVLSVGVDGCCRHNCNREVFVIAVTVEAAMFVVVMFYPHVLTCAELNDC